MTERDAVLAHCYLYDQLGRSRSSLRGRLQISAGSVIYKEGQTKNIFLAGGQVWGDELPSLAHVMHDELIRRGKVPEGKVATSDEKDKGNPDLLAKDTSAEIDLFLERVKQEGWTKIASLCNRSHAKRIRNIYKRRGIEAEVIIAEDVLANIQRDHSYRPFPYKKFLEAFRNSKLEEEFNKREDKILLVYKLFGTLGEKALSWYARTFRGSKRFSPDFDK